MKLNHAGKMVEITGTISKYSITRIYRNAQPFPRNIGNRRGDPCGRPK